jgi:Tfp pilus assembly protein PilP
MKSQATLFLPAVVLMLGSLQGCMGEDQESLTAWMQHEREIIKPNVQPI